MVSVGEPINHEAWEWLHKVVGDGRCTLVDTWWQTGECPRGVVGTGLGTSQGLEEGRFMFSGTVTSLTRPVSPQHAAGEEEARRYNLTLGDM